MNLQEKIDEYVDANGTTRDAIAEKLGMSRSSFFNKQRGSNEFSLSEAFNLSRILGVSLDELYALIAAV